MSTLTCHLVILLALAGQPLGPGDHNRTLSIGESTRSYLIHVPPTYDPKKPTPVVLVFHGAATNAAITVLFTGLSDKADEAGFIAVYPNGMGVGSALIWNTGFVRLASKEKLPDDVGFIAKLLDDLGGAVNVDKQRVYAAGISNGGMMCYALAAGLSDRIAAIASVGGTMSIGPVNAKRPVPVIHFHGTADTLVPFDGPRDTMQKFVTFRSVDETINTWAKVDGCPANPTIDKLPDKAHDGMTVTRKTYGPGKDGSEVVLYVIEGGGHTWPGRDPIVRFLGKYTKNISANDLLWEFFQKHPMQ